jgi:hypothetical protein
MTRDTKSPRAARLAEIRRRIEAGTYDTPTRLEAALDKFLDSDDARPIVAAPASFTQSEVRPQARPR